MDLQDRFTQLADDAQYDLSCACGSKDDDRRKRSAGGTWVYPASTPRGGKAIICKTLMSNACSNDCKYCPLRAQRDAARRCSLSPDELAGVFLDVARRKRLEGLFLSSGAGQSPDATMDRMLAALELIRRGGFRGFFHLKIIPGCSDAAIRRALQLAGSVSINAEAPTANTFGKLSNTKKFEQDIVRPIKLISELTARGSEFSHVKQTTQFIVGAAGETDRQLVSATGKLYSNQRLDRIYFSAYQGGCGDESLPGEHRSPEQQHNLLTREHRLYQTDFLLRKYKFTAGEIPFEAGDNLSLHTDPKLRYAQLHPEKFPIRLAHASKTDLLKVPGLGPTYVNRLLKARRDHAISFRPLRGSIAPTLRALGLNGKPLEKILPWVTGE